MKADADHSTLRWVWRRYLRSRWALILLAFALMAVEGSMLGALSYIVKPMFDRVFVVGESSAVGWVAAAVAAIFVTRALSSFFHQIIMQGVGIRVSVEMQRDMANHLLTLDSAFFNANPPGTLIERVRGDTTLANTIWATMLSAVGRDIVGLIALMAVAISVDPVWTLIAAAGVPLLFGPIAWMLRLVRKATTRAREKAAELSTRLDEIFHGMNTIKLNTSERHEGARFEKLLGGYAKQELRARIGKSAVPTLIDLVAAFGFAGVLVYGGGQIIAGEKTVGEFMSFFTAMGLVFDPLRKLANVSGAWASARASLDRIRQIFEVPPTIVSPAQALPPPERPGEADISFRDVVLRYSGEPALNGLTFTARAGETTALVGPSGAGKSTVFNVLSRLVDPNSGEVAVGGIPVGAMALGDLRRLFSVVSQEAPMFDESLKDNILLALENVDERAISGALEAAHLDAFVASLPEGLETRVGPRGSQLSGGQRQRVAIARALIRNAPILLLDEATSALDAESEVRVQEALDRLSATRTTLVIAHRLSTVRRADRIVVMENGRVVDEGRHEELLARGGTYARLHELQFRDD